MCFAVADKPAWAPDYHASAMMVPVVFVMWLLIVLVASLAAHVALRILIRRCPCARPTAFPASNHPLGKIQVAPFVPVVPRCIL